MPRCRDAFLAVVLAGCAILACYQMVSIFAVGRDMARMTRGDFGVVVPSSSQSRSELLRAIPARDGEGHSALLDWTHRPMLLFSFRSDCVPCNWNMPRWLDLVADLQSSNVQIYAVGNSADESSRHEWSPFGDAVKYVTVDDSTIDTLLGPRDYQTQERRQVR